MKVVSFTCQKIAPKQKKSLYIDYLNKNFPIFAALYHLYQKK